MAERSTTQKELARELGMTQQALSSRIRGLTSFSVDELVNIARVLDVDAAGLVAAVEPNRPTAVAS
jgi:transcriptional regulator with XRE-family HTH domain